VSAEDGAPRPAWSADRLFLVGMMGSGKTTVGRLVAGTLGWRHCDSDALVESRTGRSVVDLLERSGEAAMHAAETAVLGEAAALEGVVVSVSGGAVLEPGNRALLLAAGPVVWLRARPDTLAARVGGGEGRPLLGGGLLERMSALDAERRPWYLSVSQAAVDVDGQDPEAVARDVVLAFERLRVAGPGS
jgi:shikimate kinase